jgi:hypothetical protein
LGDYRSFDFSKVEEPARLQDMDMEALCRLSAKNVRTYFPGWLRL